MILIQQYFLSAKKERQSEIDLCLQNNLSCQFDHIVLLNEQPYTFDHFNNTQKLMVVDDYAKRLTFYDAFQYANQHYADGTIVIVSNSDILVKDEDLEKIKSIGDNDCYCLSRWYYYTSQLFYCEYSQDTWIIKTPIRATIDMDFSVGSLWGCDNVIAYLLLQQQYHVTNPSRTIKTYHVHQHQYYEPTFNTHKTLPPPYHFITPTTL